MTGILCWLLQLYWLVILAHVIFSWVPQPPDALRPVAVGVRRLVEPLAAPLRRLLPPVRLGNMALDLSILVLFFILIILQRIVCG